MVTLYHAPFTRSHLIRFALEELALPYDLVILDLTRGEHKSPPYLGVNPLGQLPALRDGDTTLCESAAIALYLADAAPEKRLAPPIGSRERGLYYHWSIFAVASELAALGKIAMNTRVLPEAQRSSVVADEGRAEWKHVATAIEAGLRGRRYLVGDVFSMADVLVGGALWLAGFLEVLAPYPTLMAYHRRVSDRPAFQRAFADARAQ